MQSDCGCSSLACWEFAWQIDRAVEGKRVWPLIAWAVCLPSFWRC